MLLVSGLGLGSSHADSMLGLQLLVDMVTGQLGDQGEQSGAATISRVLMAGNLLSQSTQDKDGSTKVSQAWVIASHLAEAACCRAETTSSIEGASRLR